MNFFKRLFSDPFYITTKAEQHRFEALEKAYKAATELNTKYSYELEQLKEELAKVASQRDELENALAEADNRIECPF